MKPLAIHSVFAAVIFWTQHADAENWPGWRGPRGDGSASVASPVRWDGETGENIQWKAVLTGEGHSCPIIWNDKIFVTACLPESQARVLICFERDTGDRLWMKTVLQSRLESKHALNSYASSTPATDGQFVYVSFLEVGDEQVVAPNVGKNERMIYPGQMVVAAYDFDGNQQWLVRPGRFVSAHGFCSNPLPYRDTIILNGDHDGDSYLVALDRLNGQEVWRRPRRHKTRSYSTPLIRTIDGNDQLVLSGSLCVASFNPVNGEPIWNVEGPTEQFVASVVYDGTHFFAAGGFPTHHVIAIRPDGHGDVTDSHVSWHQTNVRCYVPSPVVIDHYLLVADDRGTFNCFDTGTGQRLWQTRMGKHYSASLSVAGGLVHALADDGIMTVLRPGPKPDVVAENRLGENVYSSPAYSDGQLFIRGTKHLFCIGERSATASSQ